MKKIDLAWAAGFIDGEGCICVDYTGSLPLILSAEQVDSKPLEKFKELFGGSLIQKSRRKNRARSYCWLVGRSNAIKVLRKLRPYLIVKKEECDTALKYSKYYEPLKAGQPISKTVFQKREELYYKLRKIKEVKYSKEPVNEKKKVFR